MIYKGFLGTVKYDPDRKLFWGMVTNLEQKLYYYTPDATRIEKEFHTAVDKYLREKKEEEKEDKKEPFYDF